MSAETSPDDADFLHELRGVFLRAVAPELQGEGLGWGELLEEVPHPGFSVAVAALPLDLHDPLEVEIELYRAAFQGRLLVLHGRNHIRIGEKPAAVAPNILGTRAFHRLSSGFVFVFMIFSDADPHC
jgi:hypothetical protein